MTSPAGGELQSPDIINARLEAFFAPLCESFVHWRKTTTHRLAAVEAAGLVSPGTETSNRPLGLRGDGRSRLRAWPRMLHTFSRDPAWDIPVGDYGATWSHQLGAIAEAFRTDWDTFAQEDEACRAAVASADPALITSSTFYGAKHTPREDRWWDTAPRHTMREGITAVAQGLALLTVDAVPGYQDALSLAHDAVQAGLLDRLANQLPLNVLQPMIAMHMIMPGPILVRGSAGLEFGPEATGFLEEQSALYRQAMAARSDQERLADGSAGAGNGCPVARARTGADSPLTQLAGLFEWTIWKLTERSSRA